MTDVASNPSVVARAYLAAFDERDPETIAGFVSDGFVNEHTAALGRGCVGRASYLERLPGFLSDMQDLHYEIERMVVEGADVAVFYTMSGRFRGDRPFEIRGMQRLRVEDGLIAERTDYWDSAAFLVQVDDAAAEALRALGIG